MQKDIIVLPDSFNKNLFKSFLLVSYIGGKNSYSSIMGVNLEGKFDIIFTYKLPTENMDSVSSFLNFALKDAHEIYDITTDTATIGVSGPIEDPERKKINLSSRNLIVSVDEILLSTLLKKVILLNDFEAVGYGLNYIDSETDLVSISHRNRIIPHVKKNSTACVIGADHGLGCCILGFDKSKNLHIPIASEAGHMDFPVDGIFSEEFQEYIKHDIMNNKLKMPDSERFVSERGVIDLWHFLRGKRLYTETDVAKKIDFQLGDEKLKSIFINYYNDETCKHVVDSFIKHYAQFARNMALNTICFGGLYICGSIAQNHIELFQSGEFMIEFERSDKKTDILEKIPVFIITNKDIGFYGCSNAGVNFLDLI